ncbi:hypothetical protein [Pseudomonas syringae group genomosp. 7]|uniref:hypothetical protein n=1 Tax=Pseudomonas syringae group genomosp. 7 TaxID=251699 RepID=UPI0006D62970|nr:hypothetical protein [Pseudomonas syringae group genomosp. 7]UNB64224.1 hypothetical protein MME54_05385 [Pseudomonas syringae pv. helianthi]
MTRLTKLDNDDYKYLSDDDSCYHYGEYTSGGGFKASDTNQQIWNLKNKPTSADGPLYWKGKAIEYWAKMIAETLDLDAVAANTTFVPMPCSKPVGHPEYDDRMLKVLQKLVRKNAMLDIRPLLVQTQLRDSQHEGPRQSPAELRKTLAIDHAFLAIPIKPYVVVVDDVITLGASYNAAKSLLQTIPGVTNVLGVFLAKTVWPPSELDDFLDLL